MAWGHRPAHRAGQQQYRRKRVVSAAARAKQAARMKGKKHPHKGHRLSAATRAKISARLKGQKRKGHAVSSAARAKVTARLKGRHHPASHKPGTITHPRHAAHRTSAAHRRSGGKKLHVTRTFTHLGLRRKHVKNTRFGLRHHRATTHFGRHHIKRARLTPIRRRRR